MPRDGFPISQSSLKEKKEKKKVFLLLKNWGRREGTGIKIQEGNEEINKGYRLNKKIFRGLQKWTGCKEGLPQTN